MAVQYKSELQLTHIVGSAINILNGFFNHPSFIALISMVEEFAKWSYRLVDRVIRFSDYPSTKNLNFLAILR